MTAWLRDNKKEATELLSRDCDGCSHMKECRRRYYVVEKGGKVYCPDGTAHLVDESLKNLVPEFSHSAKYFFSTEMKI